MGTHFYLHSLAFTPCLMPCFILVSGEGSLIYFSVWEKTVSFSRVFLFEKHVDGSEKNLGFFCLFFFLILFRFFFQKLVLKKTLVLFSFSISLEKGWDIFKLLCLLFACWKQFLFGGLLLECLWYFRHLFFCSDDRFLLYLRFFIRNFF